MAKKKQQEIISQVNNAQTIAYQGSVKITTMRGKKAISSKVYHNSGLPSLFKFLCTALAGSYSDLQRPCKIKFFNVDGNMNYNDFRWDKAFSKEGEYPQAIDASPFMTYDVVPTLKQNSSDNSWSVTYHFRVPYAYITAPKIYLAAIYANTTNTNSDACAYYTFTKTENNVTSWDPIEMPTTVSNYSIIVEWQMAIMNK